MPHDQRAAEIRGKTIRLTWTEGPTKGATHEHVFHADGTVEWRALEGSQKGDMTKERPEYGAMKVADGVYAVSYLAGSGYTLTVVLNFQEKRMVGFASGAKEWYPVRGTFEVVT
jgi:hypothetical protein